MERAPFKYTSNEIPSNYVCQCCGATGVKLWRDYGMSYIELYCADCSAKEQKIDISTMDERGMMEHNYMIGWRCPAIPTEENDSWWGYLSVPQEGITWWESIPNKI